MDKIGRDRAVAAATWCAGRGRVPGVAGGYRSCNGCVRECSHVDYQPDAADCSVALARLAVSFAADLDAAEKRVKELEDYKESAVTALGFWDWARDLLDKRGLIDVGQRYSVVMQRYVSSLEAERDALRAQLAAPGGAMPSWVRPVIYAILESGKIAASGDNAAHYDVYDRVNRLAAHGAACGGE